jgi:ABC-type uncharacterized transport system ATPase subunit
VFQETLANIARQSAGEAKVVVEARAGADAAKASAVLAEVPGVIRVSALADGSSPWIAFELAVRPGADVREEVGRRIIRNGWPLRELRKEQPSLEDIFVRLTAKD